MSESDGKGKFETSDEQYFSSVRNIIKVVNYLFEFVTETN